MTPKKEIDLINIQGIFDSYQLVMNPTKEILQSHIWTEVETNIKVEFPPISCYERKGVFEFRKWKDNVYQTTNKEYYTLTNDDKGSIILRINGENPKEVKIQNVDGEMRLTLIGSRNIPMHFVGFCVY